MKTLLLLLWVSSSLIANTQDDYFDYLKLPTLGPSGDYRSGEIEIIDDPETILEVEAAMNRKVGIVAEDKYWIWLNDAVRFPSGNYGIYARLLWRSSLRGSAGVVVVPMLPNGKIALNRNFRHATRSWEYELPRGGIEENETPEEAAFRELKEETGLISNDLKLLGYICPDSGTLNTVGPVYLATISDQQSSEQEDSEAIASIDFFSVEEIKQGFRNGFLLVETEKGEQKVYLRDSFLAFAILQMDLKESELVD